MRVYRSKQNWVPMKLFSLEPGKLVLCICNDQQLACYPSLPRCHPHSSPPLPRKTAQRNILNLRRKTGVRLVVTPMDGSLPPGSVHGIFPARILEWVAIAYTRGSSQPRDRTRVSGISCIGGRILYHGATLWPNPTGTPRARCLVA